MKVLLLGKKKHGKWEFKLPNIFPSLLWPGKELEKQDKGNTKTL